MTVQANRIISPNPSRLRLGKCSSSLYPLSLLAAGSPSTPMLRALSMTRPPVRLAGHAFRLSLIGCFCANPGYICSLLSRRLYHRDKQQVRTAVDGPSHTLWEIDPLCLLKPLARLHRLSEKFLRAPTAGSIPCAKFLRASTARSIPCAKFLSTCTPRLAHVSIFPRAHTGPKQGLATLRSSSTNSVPAETSKSANCAIRVLVFRT